MSLKLSKSGLSLGISQNKDTAIIQPIFFSSFSFPLLFFYVGSLLLSRLSAFFFFLLLSSTFFPSALLPSLSPFSLTFYQSQF